MLRERNVVIEVFPILRPAWAEQFLRTRNEGDLAGSKVHDMDAPRPRLPKSPEGEFLSVRGPGGVCLVRGLREQFLGCTTLRRHQEDFPRPTCLRRDESYLRAVGGPTRQASEDRRVAQLKAVATICPAAPERPIRIRNVGDPLAVPRIIQFPC